MLIKLNQDDIQEILEVERSAFIPTIQTFEHVIRNRLTKNHIYLGVKVNQDLVGTLALRFANFKPDFKDFCRRYPTFHDYAENDNESDANSVFVYSLGVMPYYRNGFNAKDLLEGAFQISKKEGMEFFVGDARIPSYNGSNQNPQYECFQQNKKLHHAIDNYLRTGILPSRELIEQDPVAGFYLKMFPKGSILGITDSKFWQGDEPCGGHMVIEYLKLK